MRMNKSLWKEAAVLVREMGDGERRIAGEGTLHAMVLRLRSLPDGEWHRYSINLPDRQISPVSFSGEEFGPLLDAHSRTRL